MSFSKWKQRSAIFQSLVDISHQPATTEAVCKAAYKAGVRDGETRQCDTQCNKVVKK